MLSETQKEQIKKLYIDKQLSYTKIAETLNIGPGAVRGVLTKEGLNGTRSRKKQWSDEEIQQIRTLYKSGKTIRELVAMFHSSTKSISAILGSDIRPVGSKKKYTVNSNYFNNIDSERKAYWLGFMYADGNAYKSGQIRISSIDTELLEIFISDLEYTGVITTETQKVYNKSISKVTINDKQLFNDLCKYGCCPNKTAVISVPNIPKELMPHFVRGYFDGDGSVGIYNNESGKDLKTLRSSFCTGSEVFLPQLLEFIPCKKKSVKKKSNSNLWEISFSVNDSITLYNYMYTGATVYLKRKRDKFEQFLQMRRSETIIDAPSTEG